MKSVWCQCYTNTKLFNCELLIREDITLDELIDVIDGNRVYLNCLYCYNKIDIVSLEEVDRIARLPHHVVISCNAGLNLDFLIDMIWEYLDLIQIYTKKRNQPPDFEEGIVMRKNSSVEGCVP